MWIAILLLVIYLLGIASVVFVGGLVNHDKKKGYDENVGLVFYLSVFWPLFATIGLLMAPFLGIFHAGRFLGRKVGS